MSRFNHKLGSNKTHTFFNEGTPYAFNPNKPLIDPTNPETTQSYLDFHLNLVRQAKSLAVYVLDANGREINPYR